MPSTPNLSLKFAEAGQAQKHITLNESLRLLDALVQLAVESVTSVPPAEPADGERHIVGASPTGVFTGHADKVAAYQDGAWVFLTPRPGWRAWNVDAEELLVWSGDEWAALSAGGGGEGDVAGPDGGVADGEIVLFDGTTGKAVKSGRGTISHLGVGAPFDDTDTDTSNRLVVKASRALFYAREDAETPGTGDIKVQISKEAEGNSASFFFSTNFSGRAEFGLVESDSFALKVSPDGSEWIEALAFDPATGTATFRAIAGVRRQLSASLTLYVDAALGDDGNDGLTSGAGAFATIQKAIDAAASLDLSIYNVTIEVAAGTYAAVTLKQCVGAGIVHIKGDESTPANVVLSAGGNVVTAVDTVTRYRLSGLKLTTSGNSHGIVAQGNSAIEFFALDFGACGFSHCSAVLGGQVTATGDYAISGNSARHLYASRMGNVVTASRTVTLSGSPAFGATGAAAFASAERMGCITAQSMTFSGSATGRRFYVAEASILYTGGSNPAAYFPGDGAGTESTAASGHYV